MEDFIRYITGAAFIAVALYIYFFPSINAWKRKHANLIPIFIVNFFFALTVVG